LTKSRTTIAGSPDNIAL